MGSNPGVHFFWLTQLTHYHLVPLGTDQYTWFRVKTSEGGGGRGGRGGRGRSIGKNPC